MLNTKSEIVDRNGAYMLKDEDMMGPNIYTPPYTKRCDWAKRAIFVHHTLKFKILLPLIAIIRVVMGSKKAETPAIDYYRELECFDRAYEQSLRLWHKHYLNYNKTYTKKQIEKAFDANSTVKNLRALKEMSKLIVSNDSAYYEFFVMMSHNYACELNKEFRGENINHLIYSDKSSNSPYWFTLDHQLREDGQMQVGVKQVE